MTEYSEFDLRMKEYMDWSYSPHSFRISDTLSFLRTMQPVEEYLKNLYLGGNRITFWDDSKDSEKNRFGIFGTDTNVVAFRHFRYDIHPLHTHDYFQLNYVFSGNASVRINDKDIPVSVGDIVLLAPSTPHKLNVFSDGCVILKFYIRASTFENTFMKWLCENNKLAELFTKAIYGKQGNNFIIFHTLNDTTVRTLLLSLYTELINKSVYYCIISECKLTEIFCILVREYSEHACTSFHSEPSLNTGVIVKYITENYESLSLDRLSEKFGYSKNYMCRLLLNNTGKSFLQILNSAKIDAAENMLLRTGLPINEVSSRSGFNSIEQFYRIFKKYRSMTPKAFRELNSDAVNI